MEELNTYDELRRRIAQARLVMENDPNHELKFNQVMFVTSVFGTRLQEKTLAQPWPDDIRLGQAQEKAALLGRDRRRWNALLCAEKVATLWSLPAIEPYLHPKYLEEVRNIDLWRDLQKAKEKVLLREPSDFPNFRPNGDNLVYSLHSQAVQSVPIYQSSYAYRNVEWALVIAWADEFNVYDASKTYQEQWNGNWDGVPSVIYASYTWAGVPNGNSFPLNDSQHRKEFWNWWLDEAVPASWNFEDLNS